MLIGELVGLLIIMMHYFASRKRYSPHQSKAEISYLKILKEMFSLSLPVTGSRLVFSGLSALDAVIIPRQLQAAGYSLRHATSLFGELNGTVFTLLSFPSVFTFALATSLVPAISEAMARKEYKLAKIRCADSIRLTIIIGLPCIVILCCFADLLASVFNSADIAPVLQMLSLGGIFTYLHQTTTGILQGLGKTHLPLIHSLIGGAIRIPLMIHLTAIPQIGLIGTAAAYLTGFIIVALLNLIAVCHYVKLKIDFHAIILKPFTAGAGMFLFIICLGRVIQKTSVGSLLISIAGLTVYITVLFINGGLRLSELKRIPFINGILKNLKFKY
jgi:stage V sporulation protein B